MPQPPDGIESLGDRVTLAKPQDSSAPKSLDAEYAKRDAHGTAWLNLDTAKSDLPNILSTLAVQLHQQYQERLDRVILFGSHARGEATSDSDIDVLIVLEEPVNPTIELQQTSQLTAQLCLEHNVLISRMFMSRSRYETEQSPLLNNIRREGILL